jgi:hypothetical protein
MKCLNCEEETINPKFCSRSCSASYNNIKFPKRTIKRKCTQCDCVVRNYRSKLCEEHWQEHLKNKRDAIENKTIGEYRNTVKSAGLHRSSIHANIRGLAGSWFKHLKAKPCAHCGYDKHVELCHIKAMSKFPDSALIGEVNHKNNIIQLCPNCHWEFDNLA